MKSGPARLGLGILLAAVWGVALHAAVFDMIRFGDPASERSHRFDSAGSKTIQGALDEPARILLPTEPVFTWRGGGVKFRLRVYSDRQNYLTFQFWGGEVNENLLILLAGGRQLGYRFRGDVSIPANGNSVPVSPGHFYFVTLPLPMSATYRENWVEFELYPVGPVWLPGQNFVQYQKDMVTPSRGIYRIFVHHDGFFVPPPEVRIGEAPAPSAPKPPEISFDALKSRVNRELNRTLAMESGLLDQTHILFLAKAYRTPWTVAFRNPAVVRKIVEGLDAEFRRCRENPDLVSDDRSAAYPALTGLGPASEAILLLEKELNPYLDQTMSDERGRKVQCRRAWVAMLASGMHYLASHRQPWPEASMTVDRNLYWNNRALRQLDPSKGLPLQQTLGFLYESVGLKPWSGRYNSRGEQFRSPYESRMLFTAKGLPKEYGYDGAYGERALGLAAAIYDATRPEPGKPGDPRILAALRKIVRARSVFRYPALDAANHPVMRLETAVGWRDTEFPGTATYVQRPDSDSTPLTVAAVALDPDTDGVVQKMFAEAQYFPALSKMQKREGVRTATALLGEPEQYALLNARPERPAELPMCEKKNFVWSDWEAGVLALKDGETMLYASLYWRAWSGINFLAKVHLIAPGIERVATVREEIDFHPSGQIFLRPSWTNFGKAPGGVNDPEQTDSLHAGETLPLPSIPKEFHIRPGGEDPRAGSGDFYRLSYGPYLIGMNRNSEKPYTLTVPKQGIWTRFPGGEKLKPGQTVPVAPHSTAVLKRLAEPTSNSSL